MGLMNDEIIIIYQEVGKNLKLQKIKNNVNEFEKMLGRRNRANSL